MTVVLNNREISSKRFEFSATVLLCYKNTGHKREIPVTGARFPETVIAVLRKWEVSSKRLVSAITMAVVLGICRRTLSTADDHQSEGLWMWIKVRMCSVLLKYEGYSETTVRIVVDNRMQFLNERAFRHR